MRLFAAILVIVLALVLQSCMFPQHWRTIDAMTLVVLVALYLYCPHPKDDQRFVYEHLRIVGTFCERCGHIKKWNRGR